MKNRTFTKEFWGGFLIFVLVIVIICFFPKWFTQAGTPDFSNTGQIGDTIGGIMGPFVAIAAAGLTFLAFWVQYRANEQLREDITVERFESKFYKMLDIHIQNVQKMDVGTKKGIAVFEEFVSLYHKVYERVSWAADLVIKNSDYIAFKPGEIGYLDFIREYATDEKKLHELINKLAYGYFFYGYNYKIPESKGYISVFNDEIYNELNATVATLGRSWFGAGYNNTLGHYYRHLYHTISYIAKMDSGIISEKQKYEYAKMIRGQMSDEEQLLLYYNSLSIPGQNWNKNNKDERRQYVRENMGYIARFRMIKNISNINMICGLNPKDKYAEEIGIWARKYECDFFEQEGR